MDLFEVVYQLSKAPWWLGWPFITGGIAGLAWLHGAGRFDREQP